MEQSLPFGEKDGLQVLWADGERVFCRGWRADCDGGRSAALAVLPAADRQAAVILNRLAHEYELRDELEAAWAFVASDKASGLTGTVVNLTMGSLDD